MKTVIAIVLAVALISFISAPGSARGTLPAQFVELDDTSSYVGSGSSQHSCESSCLPPIVLLAAACMMQKDLSSRNKGSSCRERGKFTGQLLLEASLCFAA